jgi:hypothetical protein
MAKFKVRFFGRNTVNITVLFNAYSFSSEAFYNVSLAGTKQSAG